MTNDQCSFITNRLDAIQSVKRGVYEYLVLGRTFRQIKVNSSVLIPALKKCFSIYISNGQMTLKDRFLYTNEFNPMGRNNEIKY